MRLPVAIVKMPRLTGIAIEQWLWTRQLPVPLPVEQRELMGSLVAYRGHGLIFVCGADPATEQRLTIAHEAAHFLSDYLLPRQRILATLGERITDVLDGLRAPTPTERAEAILSHVQIGIHVHLLPRAGSDENSEPLVFEREDRADALALELIAPHHQCWKLIERLKAKGASAAHICSEVGSYFGLPPAVFNQLVEPLFRPSPVSFLEGCFRAIRSQR
jgi:hypothetical protein